MARVVILDQIFSASFSFADKWSATNGTPGLMGNRAMKVFKYLLCRLYDQSHGDLFNAQLTFAQTSIARKLGMSRQWVGELLGRLQDEGWVEYYAPTLATGMKGSTIFRIGRQLKRVLIMLRKAKREKRLRNSDVKENFQFSPSLAEKHQEKIFAFDK